MDFITRATMQSLFYFGNVYNITFVGETLKPRENGTKDKSSIPGYKFVRTEKDKEGNTVHIYSKVTS